MVTLLMTSRDPMTHSGDVITFKILLLSEFFFVGIRGSFNIMVSLC